MKVSNIVPLALFGLASAKCDKSALNTTIGSYYYGVANVTVAEIAKEVNRGLCDIGRANLMADVTIIPNVGQTLRIPEERCYKDETSCLLPDPYPNECQLGGGRQYYSVNGDTAEVIARRLNLSSAAVLPGTRAATVTDVIAPGTLVKIPLCDPSECTIKPFVFKKGVYKDLAEKYGCTVGQIMMQSPSYNYSAAAGTGTGPSIVMAHNCHLTSADGNYTILE